MHKVDIVFISEKQLRAEKILKLSSNRALLLFPKSGFLISVIKIDSSEASHIIFQIYFIIINIITWLSEVRMRNALKTWFSVTPPPTSRKLAGFPP